MCMVTFPDDDDDSTDGFICMYVQKQANYQNDFSGIQLSFTTGFIGCTVQQFILVQRALIEPSS